MYVKLFNLPESFTPKSSIKLDSGLEVSSEFFNSFNNQPFVSFASEGLFFLKKKKIYIQESESGAIKTDFSALQETKDFAKKLQRMLRLFKNGDVFSPLLFDIDVRSRHISTKTGVSVNVEKVRVTYDIKDDEVQELKEHLLADYKESSVTELAETYFHDSYMLSNSREKIVNLMTALEALFNRSPADSNSKCNTDS